MPPFERINAYRAARIRASLAPPVFGGVAMGIRAWRGGGDDAAGAATGCIGRFRRTALSADSQAARDAEMIWKRAGNPDVRHPVDVIRTIDGDTFEARVHLSPGPRSDHAGSPARHRCAGVEGVLSAGIADGGGRERRVARPARRGRGHDLTISGRTNIPAASSPMSRPGGPAMFRRRCSPAGHARSYRRRPPQRLVRERGQVASKLKKPR